MNIGVGGETGGKNVFKNGGDCVIQSYADINKG